MDIKTAKERLIAAGYENELDALLSAGRDMSSDEIMDLFHRYDITLPFIMDPRNTEHMTEEEFSEVRKAPNAYFPIGLGGSDAGTIIGANHFETATELALRMEGKLEPEEKDETTLGILEAGHIEEPRVMEDFLHDMKQLYGEDNVRVHAPKYMFGSGHKYEDGSLKYPWARINIDGLVELRDLNGNWHLYGLEIKTMNCDTPGSYKKIRDWNAGIVPESYYAQISYYMETLGLPGFFITCKWGMHPMNRTFVFVKKDEPYCRGLMEAMSDFIDTVILDELPEEMSHDSSKTFALYMSTVYAKKAEDDESETIELGETYGDVIREIVENELNVVSKMEMKLGNAKKKTEELVNELLPAFKKSNALSYALSEKETVYLTATCSKTRTSFDEAGFKAKYPAKYNDCLTKRGKNAGKLSKTSLTKKYPEEVKEFTTGGELSDNWSVKISLYDHEKRMTTAKASSRLTGKEEWIMAPGVPKSIHKDAKTRLLS